MLHERAGSAANGARSGEGTAHMSREPFPNHLCQVCEAGSLRELDSFRALPRVTSDANPWPAGGRLLVCVDCGTAQKVADDRWREVIAEIYRKYAIYQQSCGAASVGRDFLRRYMPI